MWGGFQPKKLNTRRELELYLAANWAEPENQVELVPGPDADQNTNFKIFFQKIKPTTLLVQHVKGQPDSSTYVQKKGCLKCHTNRETPCSSHSLIAIDGVDRAICRLESEASSLKCARARGTTTRNSWPPATGLLSVQSKICLQNVFCQRRSQPLAYKLLFITVSQVQKVQKLTNNFNKW